LATLQDILSGNFPAAQRYAEGYAQMPSYLQDPYLGLSTSNIGNVTKGLLSKTQFEKAQEIASRNAETLLGLPKGNTAMERAKAMGFNLDEPVYHGTGADIKEFNTNNMGQFGKGAYFTNQPGYASNYASGRLYQRNVPEDVAPNVVPAYLKYEKPYMVNLKQPDPTASFLKKNKYDAIINREGLGGDNLDYNEFVALSPNQIRSKFAAFDPARANEPDLLAATMAIPVSGLLEQPKDKKKKK
jgi:hypothetical protein